MYGNAGTKVTKSNLRVCRDVTVNDVLKFSVWEDLGAAWNPPHVSVVTVYGVKYGRVGYKNPPLSVRDQGSRAVDEWVLAEAERAYAAILEAYPEAGEGRRDRGTILVFPKKA